MKCVILFCIFLYVTFVSSISEIEFDEHFSELSKIRHPLVNNGEDWKDAREYVMNQLSKNGMDEVKLHSFNTSVATVGGNPKYAIGQNIIGIMEGKQSSPEVIVIAADYDTPISGDPFKNNAGGVAVLLETSKIFKQSVKSPSIKLDQTVIFVAFDLNTKEYSSSSAGKSGSYHFVYEWLPRYLKRQSATVSGVFILDSVTTYYPKNGTQILRDGFQEAFPKAHTEIVKNGKKGDFLGLVSLQDDKTNPTKETFQTNYNMDRKARQFRLQDMSLHVSLDVLTNDVVDMVNHQAQYHFWTSSKDKYPTFLLFDTDESRYDSADNSCPGGDCSVDAFLTKQRTSFMRHTVNTLHSTLVELQTTKVEISNEASMELSDSTFLFSTCFLTFGIAKLFR